MIRMTKIQACCGKSHYLFQTSKPVRKNHASIFEENGYVLPDSFNNAGIFYARSKNIVATAPYGSNRITVKCYGKQCDQLLAEFSDLLEKSLQ